MPAGLDVIVPLPLPNFVTARPNVCGLKVAVQEMLAVIVTDPSTQSAFPLQPAKTEPGAGAAVSLTIVPLL
jgi:hypothetical protein